MRTVTTLKINWSLLVLGLFCAGFSENPLVQTNYTPDPAPMVYNDTVFLYTGHDEDNATGFTMYNYLLYTSTDLVNWTDHGIIASTKSFSWANTNGAWAAQCIPRNGKFYYYCAMQLKGIGVLVSDSPYGPFTDPLGKPIVNNGGPCIDPTVMIDDDGQAYMYWGNPDAYYVKLNKDMVSYSGDIVKIPKQQSYQEGPWLYKRNNRYYLAWSSTCCPEGIGYA
ncbi:MAG: family 43 glycosylhydrolase, partial [Chitinispirillaceae bacterium]|nr:family 43 glycosylhydrolase [Chitinispirillaceae bacterium]